MTRCEFDTPALLETIISSHGLVCSYDFFFFCKNPACSTWIPFFGCVSHYKEFGKKMHLKAKRNVHTYNNLIEWEISSTTYVVKIPRSSLLDLNICDRYCLQRGRWCDGLQRNISFPGKRKQEGGSWGRQQPGLLLEGGGWGRQQPGLNCRQFLFFTQ